MDIKLSINKDNFLLSIKLLHFFILYIVINNKLKMEICKICLREFKTKQALNSHIGYHNNPNRKSGFINYNEKIRKGEIIKTNNNQFTKAKNEGKIFIVSDETKKKISLKVKDRKQSIEEREKRSKSMQLAVKKYPLSYSANNVCGRTKIQEYNGHKLNGKWELEFAKWLDESHIKWTNIMNGFEYYWNDNKHIYFPDFYLSELNIYVEIKGYERERDIEKWKVVNNLIVLKKKEIELIKNKKFNIKLFNKLIISFTK